jgi:tape measure domain-containing protein
MTQKIQVELELIDKLTANWESVQKSLVSKMSEVSSATAGATKSFGSLEDIFKGMLGAGFAQQALNQVGMAVKNFAEESVAAALKMERLDRTFRFATGNAVAGAAELAYAREQSNKLGLSFVATAEGYVRLGVAAKGTTLEGQKARDIFKAIAEASTVMGLSAGETSSALLAVEQMISKGTVQSQELKLQLGNALPGAFETAARAMGLTTKQFNKLLDSGQLASEDFLPKFAAALHASLGEAAVDASSSAQAAFNRFGNSVNDVKVAIGEGLMPTLAEVTESMAKFLQGQADGFKHNKELETEMRRIADASKDEWLYGSKLKDLAISNLANRKEALEVARRMDQIESRKTLGPAKVTPDVLTKEQNAEVAKLQKDFETAKAQTTLEGADLERAIEAADYKERLEKYKGFSQALVIVEEAHTAKLRAISAKETEEEDRATQNNLKREVKYQNAVKERERLIAEQKLEDARRYEAATIAGNRMVGDNLIAAMPPGFGKQKTQLEAQQKNELDAFNRSEEAKNMGFMQAEMARTAMAKKYSEERKQIERSEVQTDIAAGAQFLNQMSGLLAVFGAKNKSFAKAAMRISEFAAIANVAEGVTKAYAQGGIAGLFTGLTVAAAGATQIATIEAQMSKFQAGGYTGPGSPSSVAGLVHRDEYVVNSPTVRAMGGPQGVESALSGGSSLTMGDMHFHFGSDVSPGTAQMVGREVNRVVRGLMKNVETARRRNIRGGVG